ncbi:ATP-dependent nuclease [Arthrobacter sulfonylureivorans]|uniref:AAA family ATPase n=1 Tax=Arthrobacter sulfonylureivorans TaxID=2486855 RepID=A0ABY3WC07_9MICC|nr:AAA family ATPase [Arthrobacter sulfonylureivorans]UNK46088.1 AAA family ATPase [Arthrobacter sulfonylureivorans]
MRLTSVEIHRFKSVDDSGSFELEPDVTALVGKNESGKTAALQALYRVNPVDSGYPKSFDALRDYPRGDYNEDEADGNIAKVSPVTATFSLDEQDEDVVAKQFGAKTLKSNVITVSRRYDKEPMILSVEIDELAMVRHFISAAGIDEKKYGTGTSVATILERLQEDSEVTPAAELGNRLESMDFNAEVHTFLAQRVPKFVYFDEWGTIGDDIPLNRLLEDEEELSPSERTALSLLRVAKADAGRFTEENYTRRKASMEGAANSLTRKLFKYWSQNKDLRVNLDVDMRRVEVESITNNQGRQIAQFDFDPYLKIGVFNNRHQVTLDIGQRSRGFLWFFSFLAAFSEYARDKSPKIILLDEPGLSLHATAQADLLRYIEEELAPHHQVIYATHSPFMIDPSHIERCRTVEDQEEEGTKITADVLRAGQETMFPLLAAIGVDLAQTLLIGPHQLLVEGPSDLLYLTIMSEAVKTRTENTEAGLDPRWSVVPAGGIEKMPAFISLFTGSNLNIAAMIDVAAKGNQRLDEIIAKGLIDHASIVRLTEFTGTREADIEDLFDRSWYLRLLEESGIGTFTPDKLNSGRIMVQVERILGKKFDHYHPASLLSRNPALVDKLPDEDIARFADLFARINRLLPAE